MSSVKAALLKQIGEKLKDPRSLNKVDLAQALEATLPNQSNNTLTKLAGLLGIDLSARAMNLPTTRGVKFKELAHALDQTAKLEIGEHPTLGKVIRFTILKETSPLEIFRAANQVQDPSKNLGIQNVVNPHSHFNFLNDNPELLPPSAPPGFLTAVAKELEATTQRLPKDHVFEIIPFVKGSNNKNREKQFQLISDLGLERSSEVESTIAATLYRLAKRFPLDRKEIGTKTDIGDLYQGSKARASFDYLLVTLIDGISARGNGGRTARPNTFVSARFPANPK